MVMVDDGEFYPSLEVMLALVLPLLVWVFMRTRHSALQQLAYDREIERYLSGDEEVKDRAVAVLLRPFFSDGSVSSERSGLFKSGLDLLMGNDFNATGSQIESALFRALKSQYLPVRFDNKTSRNGKNLLERMSKIATDRFGSVEDNSDEWLEVVKTTCHYSSLCFVMPPDSKSISTIKEIGLLANDREMVKKLIFVMPTKSQKYETLERKKVCASELWATLKELAPSNLALPKFQKSGGFLIHAGNNPFLITGYSGSPWFSERTIKHVFLKGELYRSSVVDSLRVVNHLCWGVMLRSFLYLLLFTLGLFFLNEATGKKVILEGRDGGLLFGLGFILMLLWFVRLHFSYCYNFNLGKYRSIALAWLSIVGFLLGVCLASNDFSVEALRKLTRYCCNYLNFPNRQEVIDTVVFVFITIAGWLVSSLNVYIFLHFYHKYHLTKQQANLKLLIDNK